MSNYHDKRGIRLGWSVLPAVAALVLGIAGAAGASPQDLKEGSAATLNTVLAFEQGSPGGLEVLGVAVEYFGEPGRGEVFLDIHWPDGTSCFVGGPGDMRFGSGPTAEFELDGQLDGYCEDAQANEVGFPLGDLPTEATVNGVWRYAHAERTTTTWMAPDGARCIERSWHDVDETSVRSAMTMAIGGVEIADRAPGAGEEVAVTAVRCRQPRT